MQKTALEGTWGTWRVQEDPIVLLVSPADKMRDQLLDIAAGLANSGHRVVFISTIRPCVNLMERLETRGVDPLSFHWVDTVSQAIADTQQMERCLYVKSPSALTDLSISLSAALAASDGKLAVFLDSISALTIYSDTRAVEEFVHSLVSKARVAGAKAVVSILETEDAKQRERFAMLCDCTLEVKSDGQP